MIEKERILFLRKEIEKYNHLYYVLNKPIISDFEFDKLLFELKNLEDKYPEFFDLNSPTQRVGGDVVEGFETITHKSRMLSLGNTYSKEDLQDFDARLRKFIDQDFEYVCELKYDGVSISLTYENGYLVQALTRGDGEQGDDVIQNVRTINSIPLKIKGDYPRVFEIRGEIFLNLDGFTQMNKIRKEEGLELFANPRNTASGSLKLLDSKEVAKRPLDCFLYYLLGENLPTKNHFYNLQKAKEWGFKIPNEIEIKSNIEGVFKYIKKWDAARHKLLYEIDGIVIKVNDIDLQEELGYTAKSPRWAISYKFKTEQTITRLNEITYQVGRTGAITPVANLEAVQLGGTIVKRASLHNADQITKLDIRIGDMVYVEKGGEIIPKVVAVEQKKRDLFSQPTKYIKNCPSCNTKLIRKAGDSKHYCPNSDQCIPQIKGKFEHFISRKAMDIDGLGGETIDLLIQKGLIHKISDLYYLKREDLIPLERIAEKSANNLLIAIEKSKQIPFERVLFGLGIRYVGETIARTLVKYFKTIDAIKNANSEILSNVDEIGEKITKSVVCYFSNQKNISLIKDLEECGLQFKYNPANLMKSENLKGMKIVISGVFSKFSRVELKKMIEEHGGKNTNGISKNTSFVLAGANIGPNKKRKAVDLGIDLVGEEEFLSKIS